MRLNALVIMTDKTQMSFFHIGEIRLIYAETIDAQLF